MTCDSYPAINGINRNDIPDFGIPFYNISRTLVDSTEANIKKNNIIILAINGIVTTKSEFTSIDNLAKNLKPNKKLILINSYPTMTANPIKINHGNIKKGNIKMTPNDNSYTTNQLKIIASKYPNVFIYNLDTDYLKKDLGFINDTIAYYDNLHINLYASLKLSKVHSKDFGKLIHKMETK